MQSVCLCWNRAMRTVQKQYAPLIEGTVELIIKCYAAVHYAMLLDSAAQVKYFLSHPLTQDFAGAVCTICIACEILICYKFPPSGNIPLSTIAFS